MTKLKKVFTAIGAVELIANVESLWNKYQLGEDVSTDEIYSLVSSATGLVGLKGAFLSLTMDLQQMSTDNAIKYYEATGDEELFIKWIQPGPRP